MNMHDDRYQASREMSQKCTGDGTSETQSREADHPLIFFDRPCRCTVSAARSQELDKLRGDSGMIERRNTPFEVFVAFWQTSWQPFAPSSISRLVAPSSL